MDKVLVLLACEDSYGTAGSRLGLEIPTGFTKVYIAAAESALQTARSLGYKESQVLCSLTFSGIELNGVELTRVPECLEPLRFQFYFPRLRRHFEQYCSLLYLGLRKLPKRFPKDKILVIIDSELIMIGLSLAALGQSNWTYEVCSAHRFSPLDIIEI